MRGDDALRGLDAAVDRVLAIDLDELTDAEIKDRLRVTQRALDRLASFRSSASGVLEQRAIEQHGPGRERRAVRDTQQFLVDELRLSPSEAKRSGETGRKLKQAPKAAAAFSEGKLGQEHAKVITDVLRHLDGEVRDQLEEELTTLAGKIDPVSLGREARRRLARIDQQAAVKDEARRRSRRYFRAAQQADGMVSFSGLLEGVSGEALMTAYQAFMVPDGPGVEGTREQRAADAFAEVCLAALGAGKAPTQHGVRPHVTVVVELSDLAQEAGAAELDWTGPVTVTEIRRWIRNASLTGVIVDPDRVPVGVTNKRRNPTAHEWTGLRLRDGGCRYPNCDRPPAFCDVAHAVAVGDGGLTHLSQLVLLCRQHHSKVDRGRWRIEIDGSTVFFHAPDGRTLVSTRGDPP